MQRLSRTDLQQHDNKTIKYLTLAATYIDDREHKKILDLQMMICNQQKKRNHQISLQINKRLNLMSNVWLMILGR